LIIRHLKHHAKTLNMKLLFLIVTSFVCVSSFSQPNPGMKELREKNIDWTPVMAPKGNVLGKATTVQGRTYTTYQIGLIDTFTAWVKQSYTPIGALPQPERLALPDSKENKIYLPYGTGVSMWMWDPCYDASGKRITKAEPASAAQINVLTNFIPGISPADWFNTPTQYFFTMYYDPGGTALNDDDQRSMSPYIEKIKNQVGNYLIYFTGKRINIIMIQGNKLPLVQLSIEEVLNQGTEAVKRAFSNKKMTQYQYDEYLSTIAFLREKHKNNLQEKAFINHEQLGIYSFSKSNDLFEKQPSNRYMFPVYKIEPDVYVKARKDQPCWICISFPYADEKNLTSEKEVYNAMLHNFNYEYVYNYFFEPEKVKGKEYAPLNPELLRSANEKYQKVK
jgi:hypothetical protein